MASGPRPLTTVPVDAVALAADDSGIYWTSPANELWVLRAPGAVPIRLASGGPRGSSCCDAVQPSRPLPTADQVFWFAADVTLHRTRKDGVGDDQLARTTWGDSLTSDGRNLYWTETVDASTRRRQLVRTLPIGAVPGTPPALVVNPDQFIESVAARDGRLFWAQVIVADWPVFESTLWSIPVDEVAPGASAIAGSSRSFRLSVAGSELLFLNQHDIWTVSVGRLAPAGEPQTVAMLQPYDRVLQVDAAGNWLLASTMSDVADSREIRLLAFPLAGGEPKIIAQGLRTAAIGAPAGIVYVDAAQRLVVLPTAEIEGMISLGPYLAGRLP
jgi:hypothetical protein